MTTASEDDGSSRPSYTDLTIAALIRELQLANQRAEEAERFAVNFAALALFARPQELPPLARFVRKQHGRNKSGRGKPRQIVAIPTSPREMPHPRTPPP